MSYRIFTSESVCSGHPDKICDAISDAILDECLTQDKNSRVAVETLVTTNNVVLAGEVTTKAKVNFEQVARNVIRDLGYDKKIYNFDYKSAKVTVLIHKQSTDIATGVEDGGAGDQGMMFGYACDETKEFMPMSIRVAHQIARKIDEARTTQLTYLRPDGKSQVTFAYVGGKPKEALNAVVAVPHDPKVSAARVSRDIYEQVIRPAFAKFNFKIDFKNTIVNGTGKWEIGGPSADTGLTGRKIVVDSYGGMARIGGGAFSGKDPTKVDRSGAYGTRFVAKNIVAANLASRCEIQIAYVIGKPNPISQSIETFGTEKVSLKKIENFAEKLLDLSVGGIINGLDLKRPIYRQTAAYGHFGNPIHSWEQIIS